MSQLRPKTADGRSVSRAMRYVLESNEGVKSFAQSIGAHNYRPEMIGSMFDRMGMSDSQRKGVATSKRSVSTGGSGMELDGYRFRRELDKEQAALEREVEEYEFELGEETRFRDVEAATEFDVFDEMEPKESSDSIEDAAGILALVYSPETAINNQFNAIVSALQTKNSGRIMLALSTLKNIDLMNREIRKKLANSGCLQALTRIAVSTTEYSVEKLKYVARKVLKTFFRKPDISMVFHGEGLLGVVLDAYQKEKDIRSRQSLLAMLPDLFNISKIRRSTLSTTQLYHMLRSDIAMTIKVLEEKAALAMTMKATKQKGNDEVSLSSNERGRSVSPVSPPRRARSQSTKARQNFGDTKKLMMESLKQTKRTPLISQHHSPQRSKSFSKTQKPTKTQTINNQEEKLSRNTRQQATRQSLLPPTQLLPSQQQQQQKGAKQQPSAADELHAVEKLQSAAISVVSNLSKSKMCRDKLREFHFHFLLTSLLEVGAADVQAETLFTIHKLANREARIVLIQCGIHKTLVTLFPKCNDTPQGRIFADRLGLTLQRLSLNKTFVKRFVLVGGVPGLSRVVFDVIPEMARTTFLLSCLNISAEPLLYTQQPYIVGLLKYVSNFLSYTRDHTSQYADELRAYLYCVAAECTAVVAFRAPMLNVVIKEGVVAKLVNGTKAVRDDIKFFSLIALGFLVARKEGMVEASKTDIVDVCWSLTTRRIPSLVAASCLVLHGMLKNANEKTRTRLSILNAIQAMFKNLSMAIANLCCPGIDMLDKDHYAVRDFYLVAPTNSQRLNSTKNHSASASIIPFFFLPTPPSQPPRQAQSRQQQRHRQKQTDNAETTISENSIQLAGPTNGRRLLSRESRYKAPKPPATAPPNVRKGLRLIGGIGNKGGTASSKALSPLRNTLNASIEHSEFPDQQSEDLNRPIPREPCRAESRSVSSAMSRSFSSGAPLSVAPPHEHCITVPPPSSVKEGKQKDEPQESPPSPSLSIPPLSPLPPSLPTTPQPQPKPPGILPLIPKLIFKMNQISNHKLSKGLLVDSPSVSITANECSTALVTNTLVEEEENECLDDQSICSYTPNIPRDVEAFLDIVLKGHKEVNEQQEPVDTQDSKSPKQDPTALPSPNGSYDAQAEELKMMVAMQEQMTTVRTEESAFALANETHQRGVFFPFRPFWDSQTFSLNAYCTWVLGCVSRLAKDKHNSGILTDLGIVELVHKLCRKEDLLQRRSRMEEGMVCNLGMVVSVERSGDNVERSIVEKNQVASPLTRKHLCKIIAYVALVKDNRERFLKLGIIQTLINFITINGSTIGTDMIKGTTNSSQTSDTLIWKTLVSQYRNEDLNRRPISASMKRIVNIAKENSRNRRERMAMNEAEKEQGEHATNVYKTPTLDRCLAAVDKRRRTLPGAGESMLFEKGVLTFTPKGSVTPRSIDCFDEDNKQEKRLRIHPGAGKKLSPSPKRTATNTMLKDEIGIRPETTGTCLASLLLEQRKREAKRKKEQIIKDNNLVNKAACKALSVLSTDSQCADEILNRGAIPKLLTLVGSPLTKVQNYCANTIKNIRRFKIQKNEQTAKDMGVGHMDTEGQTEMN